MEPIIKIKIKHGGGDWPVLIDKLNEMIDRINELTIHTHEVPVETGYRPISTSEPRIDS